MMIHPWVLLGAEIGTVQEQPLPWNAPEVHVWFHHGPALACRVTRCPGDVLRLETAAGPATVPIGTGAELQWTQQKRGGYAAGTVVEPPAPDIDGLYLRINESVAGVERRHGVRLAIDVPADLLVASGRTLRGRTADLSLGGSCLAVDPHSCSELFQELLHQPAGFQAATNSISLTLPTGITSLPCTITSIEPQTGRVRVAFEQHDTLAIEQIGAMMRATEHRLASPAHALDTDRS